MSILAYEQWSFQNKTFSYLLRWFENFWRTEKPFRIVIFSIELRGMFGEETFRVLSWPLCEPGARSRYTISLFYRTCDVIIDQIRRDVAAESRFSTGGLVKVTGVHDFPVQKTGSSVTFLGPHWWPQEFPLGPQTPHVFTLPRYGYYIDIRWQS